MFVFLVNYSNYPGGPSYLLTGVLWTLFAKRPRTSLDLSSLFLVSDVNVIIIIITRTHTIGTSPTHGVPSTSRKS